MSQHPSLKTSRAGKKHRTVLKRFERIFIFKQKGVMSDDSSVFGLPKLKIVRAKIKKEKAEEKPVEGEAQAAIAAAAPAKEAPAKAATKPAKEEKKK